MKLDIALTAARIVIVFGLTGCVRAPTPPAKSQASLPKPATVEASSARTAPLAPSTVTTAPTTVPLTDQYVIAEKTEERYVKQGIAPDASAPVTNTLYKGQKVEVYETRDGWARVSGYYDGRNEQLTLEITGEPFLVARWVESKSLGAERPASAKNLNIPDDPRFSSLPRAPGQGLDERDLLILHAAARYYLETGKAVRIEGGDKSVTKPGTYYLTDGSPSYPSGLQNKFFRPGDIPDLERRIQALQK